MEVFSLIGSTCLAVCSVPELVRTIKNKFCGIGWGMLNTWIVGEILVLIYLIHKEEWILSVNYTVNILIVSALIYYKIKYGDRP